MRFRFSFASSASVRKRMQQQKRKDTKPELLLRRALHRRGLRYRLHCCPIAGLRRTPDIIFPSHRVAIEVRGCFWHCCPRHGCIPRANNDWWKRKFARTIERDRDLGRVLRANGWRLVVVWEHEKIESAVNKIVKVLENLPTTKRAIGY